MEVCIYVKLGAFGAFTLPVHPSPVLNTSHVRLASRTGRTSKVVLLKDWSALGDTFSDAQEAAASVIHGGGGGDGSCESPVSSALREVGVTCSVSRTINFVSRRRPLYAAHISSGSSCALWGNQSHRTSTSICILLEVRMHNSIYVEVFTSLTYFCDIPER